MGVLGREKTGLTNIRYPSDAVAGNHTDVRGRSRPRDKILWAATKKKDGFPMVTIVEHPPTSNEQFEFYEANTPDQHPGWTVHAIIERQRVEVASVNKSHVLSVGAYPTSITDQESHVVSYTVYLMRRRIDKALEQAAEKVARCEKEASDANKSLYDAQNSFKDATAALNKKVAELEQACEALSCSRGKLLEKVASMEQWGVDLAKLRDYLGKERYDAVLVLDQLEKMAEKVAT